VKCPYCSSTDSKVVDSREVSDAVRRRRQCPSCSQRFTTHERIERVSLAVVKKDGRREGYERSKLAGGIRTACFKRPIPVEVIDSVVDQVEAKVHSLGRNEVPSNVIGELVMDELRALDGVAYVRFASVYRQFRDVDGLVEQIQVWQDWRRTANAGGE
jgi:transcriptional repressor NrdR